MTTENLDGHRAINADKCWQCHGKLRADDGTFSEHLVSVGSQSAFAAAICQACKAKVDGTVNKRK